MNTVDFLNKFLNASIVTITLAGLLVFNSLAVNADAPSPETFNKPAELVLTLSNQWLQADNSGLPSSSFKTQNNSEATKNTQKIIKKTPVNVDCGMDVSPFAGTDNSLSSRLTGECDLHYRY